MKSAPNLKKQPRGKKHADTEVIIFAGSDAWAHAKQWQEQEGRLAGDDVPPVVLSDEQLKDIGNLKIVPDGRKSARIYKAGHLDQMMVKGIGQKLAAAGIQDADYYPEGMHHNERQNWRNYLDIERKNISDGLVIELPVKKKSPEQSDDELKPRVECRPDGVYWVTPKVDKQSGEIIRPETWLCAPVELLGAGVIGNEYYRVMRWENAITRQIVTMAIPCCGIGDTDGWRLLKGHGLNVTANGKYRAILADWLQLGGKHEEWQLSTNAGWHFGAYIMPDGSVIGESEKPILFTGKSAAINGYSVAGTAESWRDSVARLAGGNPFMMLGIATSLSAPLVGLTGADGFGVHFFEQSTAGKTTTQSISSSVWGDPDALRLTWYGTALGIANEAEAHNHGLLPLDEIGQAGSPRDVYVSAYTLFNGFGKLQGAKDGGNRELKSWRTVAISTGEVDVETFLKTEGIKVKVGQLVRLLNIPIQKATQLHGYSNGKDHADALKAAWTENHGAAGREWIKWLAVHQQEAKDVVRECRERWRNLIPESYGEQVHRVGERFSILEAALVLSGHVTGWDVQVCRNAIQYVFNAWIQEFGTGNKEHRQIIEQAESFLAAYAMSRFAPVDYDPLSLPIGELYGYRDSDGRYDEPVLFYVLPEPFKTHVANGFNKDAVARTLHEAGMLKKPDNERGWQIRTPRLKHLKGAQLRAYGMWLTRDDEEDTE
ncbi:DUF927 domain-containing protein [Escherichia coli]|nr:DUF927 domain-containing protein [Escherichia coli]EEY2487192.1 DUF927 domain-containing protein [Escherichia coli]EFF3876344.1 DUF927 domain-containing protein [Escherichia coli]EFF3886793.1 DUF927 domain-containing protein [Escherichia coli]EFL4295819.1 DUF927 domain-containing protein [Escherichia coli]